MRCLSVAVNHLSWLYADAQKRHCDGVYREVGCQWILQLNYKIQQLKVVPRSIRSPLSDISVWGQQLLGIVRQAASNTERWPQRLHSTLDVLSFKNGDDELTQEAIYHVYKAQADRLQGSLVTNANEKKMSLQIHISNLGHLVEATSKIDVSQNCSHLKSRFIAENMKEWTLFFCCWWPLFALKDKDNHRQLALSQ